jgi:hypothetical protein
MDDGKAIAELQRASGASVRPASSTMVALNLIKGAVGIKHPIAIDDINTAT